MRTFKVCPPEGLWHGASDDGGNDTFFTRNVDNVTTLSRGCLSLDYHYRGSHLYWLETIGYPILLGFCTFGNILNLIVFSAQKPNSSKNIYLVAIAICNFIYMWAQLPYYFNNVIPEVRNTEVFATFFWRSEGIWKFLIDTFVTASDWILVMFTVERLCAVCVPHQYSRRNDQGVAKAIFCVFAVLIGAIFYSLYNLIGYYWHYYHFIPETGITMSLPYTLRIWRHMQQLAIVCVPIGTYALILLLNTVVILVVLIQRKRYPAPLTVSKNTNAGDLTRILIASFVLYLIFVMPMFDLDILVLLNMYHLYSMLIQSPMYQIWYPIAVYMLNINYSINFFVYLLVSPNFRRTLRRIFCCCCRSKHITETLDHADLIAAYPDRGLDTPTPDMITREEFRIKPSVNGIKL